MEDSSQKNQIKETVNQLYALRAGLSLVDKEYDKSEKVEKRAKEEREERVHCQRELSEANFSRKEEIRKANIGRSYEYNAYESKLKKINEQHEEIERKIKNENEKKKKNLITFSIFSAIFLLSIAIILVCECMMDTLFVIGLILIEMIAPGALVAVVLVVVNFVSFISSNVHIKKFHEQKEKIEKIPEYKENEAYAAEISKLDDEIKIAEIQIERFENEIAECGDNAAKEIATYSQKGLEMYNLIVSEFSQSLPNLDERDYKHVDLIIFLLETGRAETMKEALQQVDNYIHTERIAQTVNNASQSISQSIRSNIQSLKNTIQKSTYEFGEKIDRLTYNVSMMSDRQGALIKELNDNVSKTNSSLEMQNALLEKSNVSSAKMAENVEKMRLYADEAYIKNANKW